MAGLILIAMVVQSALAYLFMRNLLEVMNKKHGEESTRFVLFARDAMESIKSKSIEEKVRVDAMRKEYDVRLEMYRDTVAKEATQKKSRNNAEPQTVITDTGQKINMADVEWLDS